MFLETAIINAYMFYSFVFVLGLILGSFLNVVIYRLPREESIIYPPSHCTNCGSGIRFYQNIPLLSYIFLRGKCHSCGSRISLVYPVVELLTALLTTLLFYKFGLTVITFVYLIVILSLIVITFIDLEYMIIPNVITLPGIVIGFTYNFLITDFGQLSASLGYIDSHSVLHLITSIPVINSFFGILLGGGILYAIAVFYRLIKKSEGMGMGDVKLLAMLGAFLGIKGVFFTIFVSSLLGAVVGITIILMKKGDMKFAIPYGPFISFGAILFIFTGGFPLTISNCLVSIWC